MLPTHAPDTHRIHIVIISKQSTLSREIGEIYNMFSILIKNKM